MSVRLSLTSNGRPLRVLCVGAHSDDLEIGCGGTLMRWARELEPMDVTWAVLSADGVRAAEARRSVQALLGRRGGRLQVRIEDFADGRFPAQFMPLKDWFDALKASARFDVIFTHSLSDRHQDHRICAELTWQTWRDHLVLEYEIPKYEGDLSEVNLHVPLTRSVAERKVAHLLRHFATQRSRPWFNDRTFLSLMQLRAIECRAPDGYAEAFRVRKLTL